MKHWVNDSELFALARQELFPAVVGDVMDAMHLRHQFLRPQIQPLRSDMVVIGRAMPVLGMSVSESALEGTANPLSAKPFGLMFDALDDLKPNEIYVCTGSRPDHALWGELMTVRAKKLGAAGVVCDGYCRDTHGILRADFPTFAYGSYGQDSGSRYKVVDFRIPIEIDSVRIDPGDILFGDVDGVCVVPQGAEQEVFTRAVEKARGENLVKSSIQGGMSAAEAWRRFGIM